MKIKRLSPTPGFDGSLFRVTHFKVVSRLQIVVRVTVYFILISFLKQLLHNSFCVFKLQCRLQYCRLFGYTPLLLYYKPYSSEYAQAAFICDFMSLQFHNFSLLAILFGSCITSCPSFIPAITIKCPSLVKYPGPTLHIIGLPFLMHFQNQILYYLLPNLLHRIFLHLLP